MLTTTAVSHERESLYGIPIVGSEVLYQNGCFRRVKYWLKGHHSIGLFSKCIMGWSGPETVVVVDQIFPTNVFDVTE